MRVITKLTKNLIHQRNYSHKFTFLYNSYTHLVCWENNPITERENARKTCASEVKSKAMLGNVDRTLHSSADFCNGDCNY